MKLNRITSPLRKLFLIATISLIGSLASAGFSGKLLLAQTESEIPIDDQARYLQNLNSPSAEDWKLTPLKIQELNANEYQLGFENVEYHVVEQHSHEWRNTTYNHNSAVTFNVHQFVEEEVAE